MMIKKLKGELIKFYLASFSSIVDPPKTISAKPIINSNLSCKFIKKIASSPIIIKTASAIMRAPGIISKMPIKNIAQITIEDSKTLRITPWDKNQIKDVEAGISASNLGLSVVSDGEGVRVIFPMLTTENRTNLVKILKEKLEDSRIHIRRERQNEIDKTIDLSEDEKSGYASK